MKDHLDVDERIGELLRRELPVPEHREGYRERVAACIAAEAPALTRRSRKKWMPELRWPRAARAEERSGVLKRTSAPRRRSGLRVAVFASIAVVLVAAIAIGSLEAVKHLGKDQPILVIGDDTLSPAATGQTTQTTVTEATASEGTWQELPLSVEGGPITALVMDPTDPPVLYAGTQQGLFKSTDGAESWTQLGVEPGASMIAVDPGSPSTVYALTADGALHKSVDSGATWEPVGDTPPGPVVDYTTAQASSDWVDKNSFRVVLVDPSTSPSTLYGLRAPGYPEYGRLLKSTDGGSTWEDITQNLGIVGTGTSRLGPVAQLWIDQSGHVLYASSFSPTTSLLRSFDGGATWEDISAENAEFVGDLVVDPRDPTRLYSYTSESTFFVSSDRAQTWSELTGPELDWAKAVSVAAPGTPAAAIEAAAAFLTDANFYSDATVTDASSGLQVQAVVRGDLLAPRVGVVIDPGDPSVLYVPTERGVYKSVDSGATWHQANLGMTDASVSTVVVDPMTPSTVYVITSAGLMKSLDGGATWTTSPGVNGDSSLVIAPSSPSTLYAWTTGGLLRSDDGGVTWAKREGSTFVQTSGVLLVASDAPDTLYANGWDSSTEAAGLYRSTDGGITWGKVAGLPDPTAVGAPETPVRGRLVEVPGDPGTLYAYAGPNAPHESPVDGGLFKSTDGGQTWAPVGDHSFEPGVTSLAIAPGDPATIWAVQDEGGGIWRSTDGGATWAQVEIEELGDNWARVVLVDPWRSDTVYLVADAGVDGVAKMIYRSLDGGGTWMSISAGLPDGLDPATLDPAPDGALYVASKQGLYKWVPGDK
jgi:photosystem II stability/assembly factor-like uncharacterized protein